MKPEDVPDELVEAFDLHSYAGPGDATPWTPSAAYASEQAYIRNGLAAVLPAHESMVRVAMVEEIALELERFHVSWRNFDGNPIYAAHAMSIPEASATVYAEVLGRLDQAIRAKVAADLLEQGNKIPLGSGFRRGLRAAARFANPPSIEDAARAVQDAYGRYERGDS